jgi:hypothetical protein
LPQLSPVARTDDTRNAGPDIEPELELDAPAPAVLPVLELDEPRSFRVPVTSTRCPTYLSRF